MLQKTYYLCGAHGLSQDGLSSPTMLREPNHGAGPISHRSNFSLPLPLVKSPNRSGLENVELQGDAGTPSLQTRTARGWGRGTAIGQQCEHRAPLSRHGARALCPLAVGGPIFFFCWLKLSMMTPMNRLRVKKEPKMMKMTK